LEEATGGGRELYPVGRIIMEDYSERVMRAAAERIGEPVFNGSIDHARVIAAAMFKHARKTVDIFSCDLNARVYGPDNVLDEAEFFLANKEHRVRILLEKMPDTADQHHPFFKRFAGYSNIKTRIIDKQMSDRITFHLMVADDDCYRFEQDKKNVAAIASWGDRSGGENLKKVFEKLWEWGSDVKTSNPARIAAMAEYQ
jgi:hypothetical protein